MRSRYELAHWTIDAKGKEVIDYYKYLPMMIQLVGRFNRSKYDYRCRIDDLKSEADLAFTIASQKYDIGRDIKFSTYLTHCVVNRLMNYLRDMTNPNQVIRNMVSLEIANESEISGKYLLQELATADYREDVLDRLMNKMQRLKPVWHKILIMRFMEGKKLREVGEEIGRTRQRVNQIESKAVICMLKWAKEYQVAS